MISRFLPFTLGLLSALAMAPRATTAKSAESAAPISRPAISGIAHVAFHSRDLPTSRSYYRDVLGYAERPSEHSAAADSSLTWFKINDRQNVELRQGPPASVDRMHRVGLLTSDADGLRRYLHARGHVVPKALERGIYGDRSFSVRDPDGRVIEFVERTSTSWSTKMVGKAMPPTRPDGTRTEIMEPGTHDGRPVPSSTAPLPALP